MQGAIKHINFRKGFGFIDTDDGQSLFFHFSRVKTIVKLLPNDLVEFEVVESQNKKGKFEAINVQWLRRPNVEMFIGVIAWFNRQKGFGVAHMPSRREVFIRRSALYNTLNLSEGDLVQFTVAERRGKQQAQTVQKLDKNRSQVFCLEDRSVKLRVVLTAFWDSTNERRKEILSHQISTPASETILRTFLEELKQEDPGILVESISMLLGAIHEKQSSSRRIWPLEKLLIDFLEEHIDLEERLDLWLGEIHSDRFYSKELPEYIAINIHSFPEEKIEKILTKKYKDLNRLVFQRRIKAYLAIESEEAYVAVKQNLNRLKELHGNYLDLNIYARDHANPYYQYRFFTENYCDALTDYEIIKQWFREEPSDIQRRIIKKLPDHLQQEMVKDYLPAEERLEFWLKETYSNVFYTDDLPIYIVDAMDLFSEEKIEEILAKRDKGINQLLLKNSIASHFPIESDETYASVQQILHKTKDLHGEYLGLNTYARNHASQSYQYRLFIEGYCGDIDQEIIEQRFKEETIDVQKKIIRKLSDHLQYEIMRAYLSHFREIDDEINYERVKALLLKDWRHSIFKDHSKIVELSQSFLAPPYQFQLWVDGIADSFDQDYVLDNLDVFSDQELKKLLDQKIELINQGIFNWKLDQMKNQGFTQPLFTFLHKHIHYFVTEGNRQALVTSKIPEIDQVYHFHFWLHEYVEESEEICDIYMDRKQEMEEEVIGRALRKKYAPLNKLIISDRMDKIDSLIDSDEKIEFILSTYNDLWLYGAENAASLFEQLLDKVPTIKIFDFGLEIIKTLSIEYSNWEHRGKTFLKILFDDPEHIASTNLTYGVSSVFYVDGITITVELLQDKLHHLGKLMNHLYVLQSGNTLSSMFQSEDLATKIEILRSIRQFEDNLDSIKDDFPSNYRYLYSDLIAKLISDSSDARTVLLLWLESLVDAITLWQILAAYPYLNTKEKADTIEILCSLIPLHKQRSDARERERDANLDLLKNFFAAYQQILKILYSSLPKAEEGVNPELLNGKIETHLSKLFPIDNDDAFQKASLLLTAVQNFQDGLATLQSTGKPIFTEVDLMFLPNTKHFSKFIYDNALTRYKIKYWVYDIIEEFDYNTYCFYYFVLTTKERRKFNKKAKAVMGDAIKSNMLKQRIPWQLVSEGEDGVNTYEASWRSIWFMDGAIKVCIDSEPEFSHSYKWDFSEEKFNFLYDYISGKRLDPLIIQARGRMINRVDGLDNLEVIIYKAELEREIIEGTTGPRGEGKNRIPINMILRNQCIQYLNILQLRDLEPTRLLEKSFNPERNSLSVDLSLLFSIPLRTGEVALIWESLELEKAKATHIFKCADDEHEQIQNQIEDYLSRKEKVRSSLNSTTEEDQIDQRRLRYFGRVDHDNFDFTIWQDRLHDLLPELGRVEIPEEQIHS